MMQTLLAKRRRRMTATDRRDLRNALLFISPWIVGFTVFLAYPIVMSFYYSLCDFSVLQPPQFVGLDNYRNLARDDVFLQALSNTAIYAAFAIPLGTIMALAVAMLLNTGVKGMAFYRTFFYLPSMVPAVAMAILWLWIFNGKYGILNYALSLVPFGRLLTGVILLSPLWLGWLFASFARSDPGSRRVRWTSGAAAGIVLITALWLTGRLFGANGIEGSHPEPPSWLNNAFWVKPAFILMSLWGMGNAMVIYLAGLQDVPVHLYEAADLDGANWWEKTRHVTLPMVSPVILFNSIMAIIATFNLFTQPYIMAPNGQPARSAYFLAVNLFDNAFIYLRMGYAAAMAWVLFFIIFALTLLAMRVSEKHVHYGDS